MLLIIVTGRSGFETSDRHGTGTHYQSHRQHQGKRFQIDRGLFHFYLSVYVCRDVLAERL